jgi:hypothetical protein
MTESNPLMPQDLQIGCAYASVHDLRYEFLSATIGHSSCRAGQSMLSDGLCHSMMVRASVLYITSHVSSYRKIRIIIKMGQIIMGRLEISPVVNDDELA